VGRMVSSRSGITVSIYDVQHLLEHIVEDTFFTMHIKKERNIWVFDQFLLVCFISLYFFVHATLSLEPTHSHFQFIQTEVPKPTNAVLYKNK
jgi:hypothetical protein